MKSVVHKLIFGELAPCGVDFADVRGNQASVKATNYQWKNVTCKNCLKKRKVK